MEHRYQAEGVLAGRVAAPTVRTVLVRGLRGRWANEKLLIRPRSHGAQIVVDKYDPQPPPKDNSLDALHADHVYPMPRSGPELLSLFEELNSVDKWHAELERISLVVCVTGRENYKLGPFEPTVRGPAKYAAAGITFVDDVPWSSDSA